MDGGSSDTPKEASDSTKPMLLQSTPQADPVAPPVPQADPAPVVPVPQADQAPVVNASPDEFPTHDPRKVFVLEPTPHGKFLRCACNCGETDCPYMESGFSPKKEPPPPVFNQWNPDLTMNGSSSTDRVTTYRAPPQAQGCFKGLLCVRTREQQKRCLLARCSKSQVEESIAEYFKPWPFAFSSFINFFNTNFNFS